MENSRNSKIIAIVALCVGVVGLSLGFAAFSNTLTIDASASVTPNSDTFNVAFLEDLSCTPVTGSNSVLAEGVVSGRTITGLKVGFTKPSSIQCTVTVNNAGAYIAYLTKITSAAPLSCAARELTTEEQNAGKTPATGSLVQAACDAITYTVAVGTNSASATKEAAMNQTFTTNNALQAKNDSNTDEVVATITINYAEVDGALADGDFEVTLPTVSLLYESVNG